MQKTLKASTDVVTFDVFLCCNNEDRADVRAIGMQLKDEGIDIEWHPAGWSALMAELAPNSIGAELRELEMEEMA